MLKHKLLNQLSAQITQLEQNIQQSKVIELNESRFDPQLFAFIPERTKTPLQPYLAETQRHFKQLCQLVEKPTSSTQTALITHLAEKLVAQITALTRELATQDLRPKTPPATKQATKQDTITRYSGYLTRLTQMQKQYEAQLQQTVQRSQQQTLQKTIAALEGRIYRCKIALRQLQS